jgi:hypothetical protein
MTYVDYNVPSKYSAWPNHLTTPDLTLIQPNNKSGMFATERDRSKKLIRGRVQIASKFNPLSEVITH